MVGSSITSTYFLTAAVCLSSVMAPQWETLSSNWKALSQKVSQQTSERLEFVSAKRVVQTAKAYQEPTTQEPATAVVPMRVKPRRLPTYYSRVVTQKQREDIYAIQDRFDVEIMALQEQIDAKAKERDLEIEAVLDPGQLEEVRRLTAEAQKKREERSAGATEAPAGDGDSAAAGDGSGI